MIIVFWLRQTPTDARFAEHFEFQDTELVRAMKFMEWLRKEGHQHVTFSSVHGDCVTKPGVDSVENGKLPDGEEYEWSKAGRAGKIRKSERDRWAAEAAPSAPTRGPGNISSSST